MTKEPPIDIYGVLGYPVKHSLSPLMHNAAFKALRLNSEYRLFEKSPEEIPGFLHSLYDAGIKGLNVTVPHKEKVIAYLAHISDEARLIGAVNTIKVEKDKLSGFNTDGAGFIKHLASDLNFSPKGKNVSIIGAGGASRAISVYLAKEKAASILLFDLDQKKLLVLIEHLKANFKDLNINSVTSIEGLNIDKADLLINATPIGMKDDDPDLVSDKSLHKGLVVYDLIYNPAQTKLLKAASRKGAVFSNGLGMLLYQGMFSFEIWTGKQAPKEVMLKALLDKH
jgi:shikimate dehydrogenase